MKYVGFNCVQKLLANELLTQKIHNVESIKHKTNIHKYFTLDPKTGTTIMIFHYIPFNVTIHIYTC